MRNSYRISLIVMLVLMFSVSISSANPGYYTPDIGDEWIDVEDLPEFESWDYNRGFGDEVNIDFEPVLESLLISQELQSIQIEQIALQSNILTLLTGLLISIMVGSLFLKLVFNNV